MVRRCLVGLNHPEHMSNSPVIFVPSGAQWFEEVWECWTTPNSCQAPPQAWFHVLYYSSNRSSLELSSSRRIMQLGDHSPEALQRTVWFYTMMHFGWRGRDKHHWACYGNFRNSVTDESRKRVYWILSGTWIENSYWCWCWQHSACIPPMYVCNWHKLMSCHSF